MSLLKSIYARNCTVKSIDVSECGDFLEKNHSLGSTGAKFCYALVLERPDKSGLKQGTVVAVSTFGGEKKWKKNVGVIRSYEWIRFASIKDYRVVGGLSKVLKKFISDNAPDDIMTYVDAFTSDGKSYIKLGFEVEGEKKFENGNKSLKLRLKLKDYR